MDSGLLDLLVHLLCCVMIDLSECGCYHDILDYRGKCYSYEIIIMLLIPGRIHPYSKCFHHQGYRNSKDRVQTHVTVPWFGCVKYLPDEQLGNGKFNFLNISATKFHLHRDGEEGQTKEISGKCTIP